MGEGLGKQEVSDIGEVHSFDFFYRGNVFRIKLDMTFSRLPVEKYFLIPEGALGKETARPPGLCGQGSAGRLGPCGAPFCSVLGQGVLGPPAS